MTAYRPTPVDPDEVPPPGHRVNSSPWAIYATGEWFKLDTVNDPALNASLSRDVLAGGRAYARRNALRFESRAGDEMLPPARKYPRYIFVRMTAK